MEIKDKKDYGLNSLVHSLSIIQLIFQWQLFEH